MAIKFANSSDILDSAADIINFRSCVKKFLNVTAIIIFKNINKLSMNHKFK